MYSEDNNYLVIRLSSIGDIVLTSPLVRCLKHKNKNINIDFLVSEQFKEVVENNPYIDNLILYNKSLSPLQNNSIKKNINKKYKIIDLQNNIRSKIFSNGLFLNSKDIVRFHKHRLAKLSLVYLKKEWTKLTPIPLRYIKTAEIFNISYDGRGLEFWLPNEKCLNYYPPENRLNTTKIEKIAIAPGANHFTKRWCPEYFAELIILLHGKYNKYNTQFVLVGGEADNIICNKIIELVNVKNREKISIKNFANQKSLVESAKLIDTSDLVITNDTGIMHIAAARRVPVAAIFGSTVPEFGFAPFGAPNSIISMNLPCRPCSHIGRSKCPKKHFDCMKKLYPEIVFKNITNFINSLIKTNI